MRSYKFLFLLSLFIKNLNSQNQSNWDCISNYSFSYLQPVKDYVSLLKPEDPSSNLGDYDMKLNVKTAYAFNYSIAGHYKFLHKNSNTVLNRTYFGFITELKYSFLDQKNSASGEYFTGGCFSKYFKGNIEEQNQFHLVSLGIGISYNELLVKNRLLSVFIKGYLSGSFYQKIINSETPASPCYNCQTITSSYVNNYFQEFIISPSFGASYLFPFYKIKLGPSVEYFPPIMYKSNWLQYTGISTLRFYDNFSVGITLKY